MKLNCDISSHFSNCILCKKAKRTVALLPLIEDKSPQQVLLLNKWTNFWKNVYILTLFKNSSTHRHVFCRYTSCLGKLEYLYNNIRIYCCMKYNLVTDTDSSRLWKWTTPDAKKENVNNIYGNNEGTFPITWKEALKLIVLINDWIIYRAAWGNCDSSCYQNRHLLCMYLST